MMMTHRVQLRMFRYFSTNISLVDEGLRLIEQDKPIQAFEILKQIVDNEKSDHFVKSDQVFYSLGLLSADGGAALNVSDDRTGGAKNKEEVLLQIKTLRRNAMKAKHANKANKNTNKERDMQSGNYMESLLNSNQPQDTHVEMPSGILITKSIASPTREGTLEEVVPPPSGVEDIVEESQQLSASFYQLSAEQGNVSAMVALGNLAINSAENAQSLISVNTEPSSQSSIKKVNEVFQINNIDLEKYDFIRAHALKLGLFWYDKASNQTPPHPDALYNIGQVYYSGRGGCAVDIPRGVDYFKRAASVGEIAAHYFLAHLYKCGDEESGIEMNATCFLYHLDLAIAGGHGGAAYYKALLKLNGDPELGSDFSQPNEEEFLRLVQIAAEDWGDADALFCLADLCFRGDHGMEVDHPRAFKCWFEAARKGHADAMCCLGACYYNGWCNLKVNYEKAFYWYQSAADTTNLKGPDLHRLSDIVQQSQLGQEMNDGSNTAHIEAWSNIASMYALGKGVRKSVETAKHILRFLDSIRAEQETTIQK